MTDSRKTNNSETKPKLQLQTKTERKDNSNVDKSDLSDEDKKLLKEYRILIKMRMPETSIKQKMARDKNVHLMKYVFS